MGYAESGHSHKRESVGKIAAENFEKLDNPFHKEIDNGKSETGILTAPTAIDL